MADTSMLIIGKLTALKVAREKRPGMYGDGGGLYLQVAKAGTKSWIFRFWVPERDAATGRTRHRSDNQEALGPRPRNGTGLVHYCVIGGSARARLGVPKTARERYRSDRRPRSSEARRPRSSGSKL